MRVVLFCGGLGMRMRDGVTSAPKPMAMIGDRPMLWHVMRYYAHYGHRDFVLCLGYGAQAVKDFFLNYDETRSNDFVLQGTRDVKLFKTDISDWRITFVDTGLHSEIGERLRRVRRFVEGEEMFLANYADTFTDAPLPEMISRFAASDATLSMLAVPLQSTHHMIDIDATGVITHVMPVRDLKQWENGGYFVLRPEVFDYLAKGEDLLGDAVPRLVQRGKGIRLFLQGLLDRGRHLEGTESTRGECTTRETAPGWCGTPSVPSSRRRTPPRLSSWSVPRSGRCDARAASCPAGEAPLSVLAIGAHPDDIEIGAGGLLLNLAGKLSRVRYLVMTGTEERHAEARAAAHAFMPDADLDITLLDFPEGRLPAAWQSVKDTIEAVARLNRQSSSSLHHPLTHTRITGPSARSCRQSSATISISPTRSPSGMATSAARRSTTR